MTQEPPRLQMEGIHKRFPGVHALKDVALRLYAGEVHALMGQNGAGKSTLIKVLTGVYPIDEGQIRLDGRPIRPASPLQAQNEGISTVYQEVNLCANLSVAENMLIGREPRRLGRIDWKEMNRRAAELLGRLHLQVDPKQLLGECSIGVQQMVAIARALSTSSRILILDEPTSSLDSNEVTELFRVIRKLKEEGMAILFVTHFLDQVYEVSDRVTILRNGELEGEYRTAELPRYELVSRMIGKDWNELQTDAKTLAARRTVEGEQMPVLQAKALHKRGQIEPFELDIYPGEVVSLAGLLGSGRTELARLLFGADRADGGELSVNGRTAVFPTPRHAINSGIAFCPEERKTEGIIPELSVRENIILAMQASLGLFKTMPRKRQTELAEEYIRLLNIKTSSPETPIKNLSGGNQQKVILGRWLLTEPKLLILDEPTRGIDVGAKLEIQKQMARLCEEGMSILFISSELEELVRSSHRIAVLRDRRKVTELVNEEMTQQEIMKAIAGG